MKKKIRLVINSISLVANVAVFFAAFAFHNVGLGLLSVLIAPTVLLSLYEEIKQ